MPGGHPTKLTPASASAITTAVAAGVGLVEAAALAGIAPSTVLQWVQRGEGRASRAAHAPYVEFVVKPSRAKAAGEARRIARIEQAGRGGAILQEKTTTYPDGWVLTERTYAPPDWRADSFHLERRYPERWGRRVQADLTLNIQALAARVAQDVGLDVESLLAEAQALLREGDKRP